MKFLRTALVSAASVSAALVPALASAAPRGRHQESCSCPPGPRGVPDGYLPALACASVGNLVLRVGATPTRRANNEGLLSSQVNGAVEEPGDDHAASGRGGACGDKRLRRWLRGARVLQCRGYLLRQVQ